MSHRIDSALWKRLSGVAALAGLALFLMLPDTSNAQGFGVYEQSTCVMARAGAGVATTCDDASDIFFNPAGLVGSEGTTISLGGTIIAAGGSFTDDITRQSNDLQNDPIPVPHFYAAYGVTPELAVGLGVYVPYGLATEWDRSFDGAFEGYNNAVESIYIQPTVSYQVSDRISVGGGPIAVIGNVELNQLVDLSSQKLPGSELTFGAIGIPFHTAFADSNLEGTGATGFGGHIGIQVEATDRLRFGARFLTPVELEYSGTATFEQIDTGLPTTPQLSEILGQPVTVFPTIDALLRGQFEEGNALAEQGLETSITMPAQAVFGVSVDASERLTLMADYQWTGWSSFDEITLEFENQEDPVVRRENFGNTSAFRIGAEYTLTETLTARTGYLFNQSAAPDEVVTPLLPEDDRNHFTVGLGWQAVDLLRINAAYQYLGQNDRRGRTRGLAEGRPDTNGLYSFDAHLFGLTLTLSL